jgi:hypothetical protein
MELCLFAGASMIRLGVAALTLAWTHSVEKTQWEEDWRLTAQGLVIVESRIEGTGAGMEPPDHARFDGKWYRWQPKLPPLERSHPPPLRRSGRLARLPRGKMRGDGRVGTGKSGPRTTEALRLTLRPKSRIQRVRQYSLPIRRDHERTTAQHANSHGAAVFRRNTG